MTNKELLIQEIENLPPELIIEALYLIRSIKTNHITVSSHQEKLTYRPASGRSVLRHAGTWEGDDFDKCLQLVYATRGKAKFDDNNPFE
jgi:hypothetical protein